MPPQGGTPKAKRMGVVRRRVARYAVNLILACFF